MEMDMLWLAQKQNAAEYLQQAYEIPKNLPSIPMPDEPFVTMWQEAKGREVLDFLTDGIGLPAFDFVWRDMETLELSFAGTMGGKLPVIDTGCHEDFRSMEALLNGREEVRELPLTVNAFTIEARAESIHRHRVLLLNHAPYSSIAAKALELSSGDWLERSYRLRLRHECAHYETLRLLGGMRNHALDEILADALGQIAAFGDFDADRQRLFFGLEKGKDTCTGRLSFYCQRVKLEERHKVYRAVNEALEAVSEELREMLSDGKAELELLMSLAGRSVAERIGCSELMEKY